jgi:hypothetical protein
VVHRRMSAVVLVVVLLLSACASTSEPVFTQEDDGGGGAGGVGGEALERHWAFLQRKAQELRQARLSEEEWRQEQLVLAEMVVWLRGRDAATLART